MAWSFSRLANILISAGTKLSIGSISNGQYLKRSGTTIVGDNPSGSGDVVGPASATDGALVAFDGTTGKQLKAATAVDGDLLPAISTTKKGGVPATGTPAGKYLKDDGTWATPAGTGDVTGPASATDGTPAVFDGATGKLLKQGTGTLLSSEDAAKLANVPADTSTELSGKISSTEKGAANGVAPLGADSKIASTYIPALALVNVYEVADEAAQLALDAESGDVACRADESKTYMHNGGSAGDMTDWTLLKTPTSAVLSVAGQTGVVSKTDLLAALNVEDGATADTTMVGDSGSGGAEGLVPAPAAGDAANNRFLKANGQWETPPVAAGWDGDITDMDIDGGTDIGADLADADLIVVDAGGAGTNRKSAVSRVWTYIWSKFTGADGKTTPVDADTLPLSDSAASGAVKKLTWANVKAVLKTYFDTLYIVKSIGTAKGDLIGFSASGTPVRVAVGDNGQVLTADSAQTPGVKWADGGGNYALPMRFLPGGTFFPTSDLPSGLTTPAAVGMDQQRTSQPVFVLADDVDSFVYLDHVEVPAAATGISFRARYRFNASPGAGKAIVLKMFVKQYSENAAEPSWSAGYVLNTTSISVADSTSEQVTSAIAATMANLGMTAGKGYEVILARMASSDANDTAEADCNLLGAVADWSWS